MQMPLFVFFMHMERRELSACVAVHVAVCVAGVFSMQMERCVLLVCVAVCVATCAVGFAAVYILYAYGMVCVTSVWCKVCCCSVC